MTIQEGGFHVPGEQIIGAHPWVRSVDGRVVRYVNPTIEDPAMALLRNIHADNVIEAALERNKNQLETEIDTLREAGVPVVGLTVKVEEIPVWKKPTNDSPYELTGSTLGLSIDADYIFGVPSDHYRAETVEEWEQVARSIVTTTGGLRTYVNKQRNAGIPMMREIYTENQFMFGSTEHGGEPQMILVDPDPYYALPSANNARTALSLIKTTQEYLLRMTHPPSLDWPE